MTMKILIVENEANKQTLLVDILSPHVGSHVAANSNEAIAVFEQALDEGDPFSLVCLNIMSPETEASEALQEIRKTEQEKEIGDLRRAKILMGEHGINL